MWNPEAVAAVVPWAKRPFFANADEQTIMNDVLISSIADEVTYAGSTAHWEIKRGSSKGVNWDTTRGLGATVGAPVSSCAEENLLCYGPAQDVYDGENICVHETAHSLQGSGCKLPTRRYNAQGSGLNAAIDTAYEAAKSNGRWSNTYAISTHEEFWAEGVQAFYNVDQSGPIGGDGVHNHVDTRAELEAYAGTAPVRQDIDGLERWRRPPRHRRWPMTHSRPRWRPPSPLPALWPS